MLQFEEAMAQFNAMFPNLNSSVVETVLRNYDGDVSRTIDELLRRSGQEEGKNSETDGRPKSVSTPPRDQCANDEKIALLVQNREFLRYLSRDPNFQREMLGRSNSSDHRHGRRTHRHHSSIHRSRNLPVLLTSSHTSQSPNTIRFFQTPADVMTSPAEDSVGRVPEGPLVEFQTTEQELAIPEGPLIDYVDSEHRPVAGGWTKRLKAKFTTAKKGSQTTDYELMQTSSLDSFSDQEIRTSIDGMDRESKGIILGLARKFGKMRTND
ncbi:hypothetical protein niasHS_002308 [Heterodera schachtii]|uniref:CUE domain-containing protein n=1 Tax=Heterodera schachtii TaxID=97005 RepID=A0ABD2KK34_HETSC